MPYVRIGIGKFKNSTRKGPGAQADPLFREYAVGYHTGMITKLRGRVAYKTLTYLVLDVGGVGYKISATADTLSKLPAEGDGAELWTHLAVRETSLDLYGFF